MILRDVQRDGPFRHALAPLVSATDGTRWVSTLAEALIDDRLVFLFPELKGEAWMVSATGVLDMEQLSILRSDALGDALARIGAPDVAPASMLAVLRGRGAQQAEDVFGAAFHVYPWQAVSASDGMPIDGVYTWTAPGGTGTHSLPPDFRPGTLESTGGARIFIIVGPRSAGVLRGRVGKSSEHSAGVVRSLRRAGGCG
jgi:hypothetical protein